MTGRGRACRAVTSVRAGLSATRAILDIGLRALRSQRQSKIDSGSALGETDDMALVGILSTQLVHRLFVKNFRKPEPLSSRDRVKLCSLNGAQKPVSAGA